MTQVRVPGTLGIFSRKMIKCDGCGTILSRYHEYQVPTDHHAICDTCFRRGLATYRRQEFSRHKRVVGTFSCSLCGKTHPDDQARHVCSECSHLHLDNTHWRWDSLMLFGTPSDLEVPCNRCGGLLLIKQDLYSYLRPGRREPSSEPYSCVKDNGAAIRAQQKECIHDYLVVFSQVKAMVEGERDLAAYQRWDPLSKEMFQMGPHELSVLKYGEVKYWCWKCGSFIRVSPPQRPPPPKGLLPGY